MKKMKNSILALLLIFSVLSCKQEVKKTNTSDKDVFNTEQKQETVQKMRSLTIALSPKSNSTVTGTAKFVETNGVVQMTADDERAFRRISRDTYSPNR